jgi:hypothetical protein
MNETQKTQIFKYIKQCIAILLVVFILLNMLFVGMGKISLNDFWLGILFIGGVSWIFYRDQSLNLLGRKIQPKKTEDKNSNKIKNKNT